MQAKRKQLLIITGVFPPEPIVSASILYDLATELSNKYQVTVLRPVPSRPLGFKLTSIDTIEFPFKVLYLKSYIHPKSSLPGRLFESYSMGKQCRRYIVKNHDNIDLIYNAPWQLVGRYMVAKTCKKYGIPYITPVQDIYPESITSKIPDWIFIQKLVTKLLLPIDRYTLANAIKIHTISDRMKNYLSSTRGIQMDRFFVIHNWQNENDFLIYNKEHKTNNVDKKHFTFMYMGNIGHLAGIEILIDAFVKTNINNSKLIIAGSGPAKLELQEYAKRFQDAKIEFQEVPYGKVPEFQDNADVLLLPVRKGFSLTSIPSKLPAYLFSSKPVLASVDSESDIALTIIKANCGWISEPENSNMLSKYMKKAFDTNSIELNSMGQKGFNYSMQHFSRKLNLPKLCQECEQILN